MFQPPSESLIVRRSPSYKLEQARLGVGFSQETEVANVDHRAKHDRGTFPYLRIVVDKDRVFRESRHGRWTVEAPTPHAIRRVDCSAPVRPVVPECGRAREPGRVGIIMSSQATSRTNTCVTCKVLPLMEAAQGSTKPAKKNSLTVQNTTQAWRRRASLG